MFLFMENKWQKFWFRKDENDIWEVRFGAYHHEEKYFRWDRLGLVCVSILLLFSIIFCYSAH